MINTAPCENWTWRYLDIVSAQVGNHEMKKAKSDGIDEQIDRIKKWKKEILGD